MKRVVSIIAGIGLLIVSIQVSAARLTDLYQADIAVADKTSAVRQHVLPQALKRVLIKVSGNAAIDSLAPIKEQLTKAASLVQQYQYDTVHRDSIDKRLLLRVRFAKVSIDKLLQAAGQAVWSRERPLIALWLVGADGSLMSATSHETTVQYLEDMAAKRGLAIVMPLGDLEDLQAVSTDDIVKEHWAVIKQASQRYGADAIVIAQIGHAMVDGESTLQSRWVLRLQDEPMSWQVNGEDEGQMVKRAIDNMADALAARYAVLPPSVEQTQVAVLTVSGIESAAEYGQLNQYLHEVDAISDIQVTQASADEVEYQLTLTSGVATFLQALKNQNRLVPISSKQDDSNIHFYYRYLS